MSLGSTYEDGAYRTTVPEYHGRSSLIDNFAIEKAVKSDAGVVLDMSKPPRRNVGLTVLGLPNTEMLASTST